MRARALSIGIAATVSLAASVAEASAASPDQPLSAVKPQQLFALVIGCNSTHDVGVPPLRYADDDAIQNAMLIGQLGAEVVLLVTPDRDSRAVHPSLATAPATKAAVHSAMAELNRRMREARDRGKAPIFYFFYSGHGDVRNNQGRITLEDSVLPRDEFLDLLKSSQAVTNHVVIDACKSYFFVFERGGERSRVRGSLTDEARAVPANTGIFLSTSAAADSHEWEAFQGGVFSHEMRSALRGAADADGDGAVTYEEAAGFIWTANRDIPSRRYRPDFFFRPAKAGGDGAAILADLRVAGGDRLVLEPGSSTRAYVEDGLGTRYLDVHSSASQAMQLLLPAERPLFVRWPAADKEAELPHGNPIYLAALATRSLTTLVRGAEHVAFGRLFSLPFDRGALVAFRARPPDEVQTGPVGMSRDWTWARRSIGLAALAVGVSGGVLTALAVRERDRVGPSTSGLERAQVNHRIDGFNTAAVTCYAVAGTAAAAYLIWTLWPSRAPKIHVQPPSAAAGPFRLSMEW